MINFKGLRMGFLLKLLSFVAISSIVSQGLASVAMGNMSNASLNGKYLVGQFMDYQVSTGGHTGTTLMEFTFDGNGDGSYIDIENSRGVIDSGTGSYSVDSSGILTFDLVDDKGIVSSNGEIFIIVDANSTDDVLHLMVGIKKFYASGASAGSNGGDGVCFLKSLIF
jgi:hypothetical protein